MGKKRDKKKAIEVEERQDDSIDDIVAAIEKPIDSIASKHRKKKKKHVDDAWDDEIESKFEMLSLKTTSQTGLVLDDDEDDDVEEEEESEEERLPINIGKKQMQLNWDVGMSDEDENISSEEEEEVVPVVTQPKKGKKKKKVVEDASDEEEAETVQEDDSKAVSTQQSKKGKKSKKKRGLDDDWEADIEKELEMIASGVEPPEEKNDKKQEKQKGKGKKERKKNNDWDDDASKDVEESSAPADEAQKADDFSQAKTKQGKKSKKRREVDDWEDDIEKELEMIATGQEPPEEKNEKQEKPKGKGKKEKRTAREKTDGGEDEVPTSSVDNQQKKEEKDAQIKSKKGKKGKKTSKDDEWVDDILAKLEKGEPEEPAVEEKKDKGKKSKKKRKEHEAKEAKSSEPVAESVSEPVTPPPDKSAAKVASKLAAKTVEEPVAKAVIEPAVKPVTKPVPKAVTGVDDKPADPAVKPTSDEPVEKAATEETSSKKKKKKKKDQKEPEEEKTKKKKPSKAILMMQEALRKRKEEEERLQREEEERIRKEEEAYQKKLAAIEEEKRRKEKKRQDKKARIQKQKEEGTYLTPSQREAKRKREAYLKALKEQGIQLPIRAQDSKLPKYDKRKKPEAKKPKSEPKPKIEEPVKEPEPEPIKPPEPKVVKVEESESEDDWEAMADKEEEKQAKESVKEQSSSSEETSSSEEEESEEELSAREKAKNRMEERQETNQRNRSIKDLRSPVICVMGHVDTGKTKILDKIRRTNVQDGEAGGITQQIGATNIPKEAIEKQTKMVEKFAGVKVPGLLVIDTPGHESFSNLRSRGSSICDMAILVVDIMHGLEPQTIESLNMLRKKKTPFVVALNKIDRIYQWKQSPNTDVVTTIKQQNNFTKQEFEKRVNEIIVEFAQQELNVKLFHENDDPNTWISMVPTSAHSGDGMGNLMAHVVEHCQSRLAERLAFSENLQCTVLEVKAIHGLGTTVDVILTNGRLKYGDIIVLPGAEGPIVTHIKDLLMPQPLKELRVKNPYDHFKEVKAAQGVKVLAKELDKALAGTSLLVARRDDEIEILKEEVQREVDEALKTIKLQERGVFVQASTLGSLEALLEFLKQSKIPYAGINIGPIHKRDVMKASVMLEHDDQWAVILAFDVKVEREAQELADSLDVKIFTADIIYHLFDAFMKHREDLKRQKQDEFRHLAIFPCKVKIVPKCVFKSRDPIVIGVSVEAGQLRVGTPLCVPGKDFLSVGLVASIEMNHKPVEVARKPQEVCIKIEGASGEAPKMVGRHFDESDVLTSKISRDSIDLLKNWFRDDMQKSDWQLIIELKKLFEII